MNLTEKLEEPAALLLPLTLVYAEHYEPKITENQINVIFVVSDFYQTDHLQCFSHYKLNLLINDF